MDGRQSTDRPTALQPRRPGPAAGGRRRRGRPSFPPFLVWLTAAARPDWLDIASVRCTLDRTRYVHGQILRTYIYVREHAAAIYSMDNE